MSLNVNADGEIKVIDAKGNVKWFAPILAHNALRMKEVGFSLVPEIIFAAPVILNDQVLASKEALEPEDSQEIKEQNIVADRVPAKRGPKPKK